MCASARPGYRPRRSRLAPSPDEAASHSLRRAHRGERVIMLVCDLDVRVVSEDGVLLRHLTLDPDPDYQPLGTG